MRILALMFSLSVLAACTGGSGPRSAPEPVSEPATGVSVSGYARTGVVWEG